MVALTRESAVTTSCSTKATAAVKRHPRHNFSREQLEAVFDLPLARAAVQLESCPATLKRACRRLNIPRWPYRRRELERQREKVRRGQAAAASSNQGCHLHFLHQQQLPPKKPSTSATPLPSASSGDGFETKSQKSNEWICGVSCSSRVIAKELASHRWADSFVDCTPTPFDPPTSCSPPALPSFQQVFGQPEKQRMDLWRELLFQSHRQRVGESPLGRFVRRLHSNAFRPAH